MQYGQKLSINNLSFAFDKKSIPFFRNLNADFNAEHLHFIQGSNGVGKSTLFRILSGNLHSQEQLSGTIKVGEQEIAAANSMDFAQTIRKYIKVVQQNIPSMLADQFSVKENLQASLFERYPSIRSLPTDLTYTDILQSFGIDVNIAVQRLSGGQKQILAILMVLQKEAPVLLLDEPVSALDPKNTNLVMNFLQELSQKLPITVLIINHDKDVIETYAKHGYMELYANSDGARNLRVIGS